MSADVWMSLQKYVTFSIAELLFSPVRPKASGYQSQYVWDAPEHGALQDFWERVTALQRTRNWDRVPWRGITKSYVLGNLVNILWLRSHSSKIFCGLDHTAQARCSLHSALRQVCPSQGEAPGSGTLEAWISPKKCSWAAQIEKN